jgi:uncharacterized membrane protein YkoI
MRRVILLSVAALLCCAWLTARADEKEVPLDKVPKAVMEAFKARFKDAKPTGAAKETEDNKTFYEITFKDKGMNVDVTFTPEGELVSIERQIAVKELPEAVSKTLDEKYPKATIKIAEKVTKFEKKKEQPAYYEVQLVTSDKKKLEVELDAKGKILKEEKKSDKDD